MNFYLTNKQPPKYKKLTFEDFLFSDYKDTIIAPNTANTVTRIASENQLYTAIRACGFNELYILERLKAFNEKYEHLRNQERKSLYSSFHIPKKSGRGWRKIDAPVTELKDSLRELKLILENDCHAMYHTSAFAYVKGRSTLDAVKRHQFNESKWFGKFDISNFFGSTTIEFVMKQLSMIFPFCIICKNEPARQELEKAIELAFLDGGLPQGTPISPVITNIMMIPIDHALSKELNNFKNQRFIYTRYADDFLVSSRYDFDINEIESLILNTLESFCAPFKINTDKTRYGSSSGRNWNLGLMLNKDNEITVGHKKKRQFQSMLFSYAMDKKSGKSWDIHDIQILDGYRSYYTMIEGECINNIIEHISRKTELDIMKSIKSDLSSQN